MPRRSPTVPPPTTASLVPSWWPQRSPWCSWSAYSSGGADDDRPRPFRESRTQDRTPDVEDDRKPDSPTDLSRRSWAYVVRKTMREFGDDHCTDLAAALTYYADAVLALFPAAIALISLLGVVGQGQSSVDNVITVLTPLCTPITPDTVQPVLEHIATSQSAGLGLVLGIIGALWSASGYVGAFGRAMNAVYEIDEGRPFWLAAPGDADRHPGGHPPGSRGAGDADRVRSARIVDRLRARAQHPGGHGLEHREMAHHRAVRRPDRRDPLLHDAEREAAEVPMVVPRRDCRDPGVDRRLGRVHVLRLDIRELRQDLRLARRSRGRPAVALDHQPGAPVRQPSWTPSSSAAASDRPGIAAEEELQLPARDTRGITKARKKEQKDLARGRAIREEADESITTDTREKTP